VVSAEVLAPAAPAGPAPRPTRGLLDDLAWFDIGSSYSRVHSLAYPVDPMRRFRGARPHPAGSGPADAEELRACRVLLEWAYGYRGGPSGPHGRRRRAPSAGALYPTEVLLLACIEGRWRVLHYDFRRGEAHVLAGAEAEPLASSLELEEERIGVLLSTVLWRSAQRYGARCYLYSLLDAGHVAANLWLAGVHFGCPVQRVARPLAREHESRLGLRHGEGLVAAMQLQPSALLAELEQPAFIAPSQPPSPHLLAPPLLSPTLRRITDFHRRALADTGAGAGGELDLGWLAEETSSHDFVSLAEERHSAAGFSAAAVGDALFAALLDYCSRLLEALQRREGPSLEVYVTIARVEDRRPEVRRLCPGGDLGPVERDFADSREVGRALRSACQEQGVAAEAAFTLVIAAPLDRLRRRGHGGYRISALTAGGFCAGLYREAARLGLGTTSIGGFDGEAVRVLLGEKDIWPLVVQAFGIERTGVGKQDAATVIRPQVR
jgi:nitroreductase